MNKHIEFSDEELTAYLDGEHEYVRAEEINRALSHDQTLRARLEQLSVSKEELQSAFDDLLDHAPPLAPESIDTPSPWKMSIGAAAAIAVICFSLGWGINHLPTTHSVSGWKNYAAVYQALYINSTLSHINNTEEHKINELKRVSLALGKDINLPDLSSFKQLDYKRAQILGYEGQPLIQLAFLSSVDAPIALCIMRTKQLKEAGVSLSEIEGMSAASWEKDGYAYLLIGGNDSMLIKDTANKFASYL